MRVFKQTVTVTCGLAVALTLTSCSGKDETAREPVLRPVRAEPVFASGAARTRTFTGVARAGVESRISFKVSGTVQQLAVKVGDNVRIGQVIASLDPADYRLQLEDTQSSLVQAQAQERNASSEYERVRGLYENRNASRQDLDAARAGYESAKASSESIKSRLELAQRQLDYCRLTAPIAGSIASLDVEVNENVQSGQTVCLLTSGSDIEVQVAIPGVLIAQVSEGDAINIEFDALPGRAFPGRVTEVGVASTGMATTFPVTVRPDAATQDVRSGMAANVSFSFGGGGREDRFVVRTVAVCEDGDGRFVWVVEPGGEDGVGVVHRRPVAIGDISNDGIEVTDGLSDGDFVVTAGVSKLVEGMRVRFDSEGSR